MQTNALQFIYVIYIKPTSFLKDSYLVYLRMIKMLWLLIRMTVFDFLGAFQIQVPSKMNSLS